ncbi:MAG: tellurite resistance/C4-dicarboxylate transporter family protein [Acidobacteriaceae bacterium]
MRLVSIKNRVAEQVQHLHPAYFAMVMSTGAVAISAELLGMPWLARGLTWLNLIAFVILSAMTVARVSLYPRLFWEDLTNHSLGLGFFTIVAGAGILGAQYVIIVQHEELAKALLFGAILLWIVFTYTIFVALTVKKSKPSLAEGINGGWLLAVVGTQAVANLGTLLLPTFGHYADEALFFCLCLWLCGGMIYIWIISLIFYRYTFYEFSASDLMPPYRNNMGAMAISTLTGSMLIKSANSGGFLLEFVPFLKGFTVFFWATATWWIPMLVALGLWRHVYKGFALSYDPLYWGAVFPLGMYTLATCRLSEAVKLPFLLSIPRYFIFIALAAWLAAFFGLVHRMALVIFHAREKFGA